MYNKLKAKWDINSEIIAELREKGTYKQRIREVSWHSFVAFCQKYIKVK